jgi:hypothetical protein
MVQGFAFCLAAVLLGAASTAAHAQATASSCQRPEHRQFDFWIGRWDVYPTGKDKLVAHSLIESPYGGCVIREHWMPLDGTEGGSLNTYDPANGHWHQIWMDAANARVSFDGGYAGGKMILTGPWMGAQAPGQVGLVRMTYSPLDGGSVRQFGEISTDQGASWKPFFDFTYKASAAPK